MKKSRILTLILAACTILSIEGEACTGIKLIAKDDSFVHGRTLEFGVPVDIDIAVVPRGYAFKGTTPNGTGLVYNSKFAAVGAMAFGKPSLMDGLNEKGLAVGTFYFPDYAKYTSVDSENQSKGLSPVDFPNWLLTQFATVDEVKKALESVVIVPTITEEWGPTPAPFHYIVYDSLGQCLVIEPLVGKLVTYDNPLGVLTNSPTFDWHMTNLRNYINMSPFDVNPITINGVTLKPFGMGSGMVGMPGDFTPPSRFVRASIFSTTAIPSENAHEAIFQLFHLLNQFDIPFGVAKEKVNGEIYSDQTQLTCARDPQLLVYYFRSYKNQDIQSVDLKKFDLDAKDLKRLRLTGQFKTTDISSDLK